MLAFFVEVAAFEAEGFSGVGHVVVILFQDCKQRFAFEGFDALGQDAADEGAGELRVAGSAGRNGGLRKSALDGGRLNFVFIFEKQHAFDDVAQLANIAGPRVALEFGDRFGRKGTRLPVILFIELLDEVLSEHANIFAAFAQRRQHDGKNEDAMIEIFAEGSLPNLFFEIAMGSNNHANVHSERFIAADPLDFAFFQHAQ